MSMAMDEEIKRWTARRKAAPACLRQAGQFGVPTRLIGRHDARRIPSTSSRGFYLCGVCVTGELTVGSTVTALD
jgi:hypothetical protein